MTKKRGSTVFGVRIGLGFVVSFWLSVCDALKYGMVYTYCQALRRCCRNAVSSEQLVWGSVDSGIKSGIAHLRASCSSSSSYPRHVDPGLLSNPTAALLEFVTFCQIRADPRIRL